jgi:shikimate dehydrogenase
MLLFRAIHWGLPPDFGLAMHQAVDGIVQSGPAQLMMITGQAKLAGVIGWPVRHSLSPALHGFWLEELGVDGAYIPVPVTREALSGVVAALQDMNFAGVNVTIPHKEAAFALAHELANDAIVTGAVNLLLFQRGRIVGCNTDAEGLLRSLKDALGAGCLAGAKAVVLGAGGAARAALLACDRLGAAAISIVARRKTQGAALKDAMQHHLRARIEDYAWEDWRVTARDSQLVINATAGGLKGREHLDISLDALHAGAAVCDLVYNPLATDLLRTARSRGHPVVDGLGMLMYQAVPAFHAFYGREPSVTSSLRERLESMLHVVL